MLSDGLKSVRVSGTANQLITYFTVALLRFSLERRFRTPRIFLQKPLPCPLTPCLKSAPRFAGVRIEWLLQAADENDKTGA